MTIILLPIHINFVEHLDWGGSYRAINSVLSSTRPESDQILFRPIINNRSESLNDFTSSLLLSPPLQRFHLYPAVGDSDRTANGHGPRDFRLRLICQGVLGKPAKSCTWRRRTPPAAPGLSLPPPTSSPGHPRAQNARLLNASLPALTPHHHPPTLSFFSLTGERESEGESNRLEREFVCFWGAYLLVCERVFLCAWLLQSALVVSGGDRWSRGISGSIIGERSKKASVSSTSAFVLLCLLLCVNAVWISFRGFVRSFF